MSAEAQKKIVELYNLEDEDSRNQGIKLVTQIFGNILKDPSNQKFRDLNFSKIRKRFSKCRPCLYILFSAGFSQNVDGSRLQLDTANIITMKMLRETNEAFLAAVANGGPILPNQNEDKIGNNNHNKKNNGKDINMEDNSNDKKLCIYLYL